MTPEELDDLILGSMTGTLPEEDRRRLEAELAAVPEAARRFAELALQEGLLREMAETELKAESRPRKVRAFHRPPRASLQLWLWAGAAAVLVIVTTLALFQGHGEPERPETAGAGIPVEAREPEIQPDVPPPPRPEPLPVREEPAVDREEVPPPAPPSVPEPQAPPRPEPPPPPPEPKPAPEIKPPAPAETRTAVARLEDVHGEVFVLSGSERLPAGGDLDLFEGQGVETAGAEGGTAVKFPDGTRLEVAAGTLVRKFSEVEEGIGKFIRLERGTVTAEVVRQPPARPMVLSTPHAVVRVIGTGFTLSVGEDSTRLEVREGKVRLARPSGIAAVVVSAGQYTIATPGIPLEVRPIPVAVRVSFGPSEAPLPEGFLADDGSPYDRARGYGWDRDRRAGTRLRSGGESVLVRRSIIAGDARAGARWEYALADGTYEIAVACGGELTSQGPHRIRVEGVPLFRDVFTAKGEHRVEKARVRVRDGHLTLEAGAVGSSLRASDGTHDTIINYIIITRLR